MPEMRLRQPVVLGKPEFMYSACEHLLNPIVHGGSEIALKYGGENLPPS